MEKQVKCFSTNIAPSIETAVHLMRAYEVSISLTGDGEYVVFTRVGGKPDKVSTPFKTGYGLVDAMEELIGQSLSDEWCDMNESFQNLLSDDNVDDDYVTDYDLLDSFEFRSFALSNMIECRPGNIRMQYVYKRMKWYDSDYD